MCLRVSNSPHLPYSKYYSYLDNDYLDNSYLDINSNLDNMLSVINNPAKNPLTKQENSPLKGFLTGFFAGFFCLSPMLK